MSALPAARPETSRPCLLVLASTYPRWRGDDEPGFVHTLCAGLAREFDVHVVSPHAPGAASLETLDGVTVHRFCYAPAKFESLIYGGGIINNLKQRPWKWALVPGFFLAEGLLAWRLARKLDPVCIHAHWIIPQGLVALGMVLLGSRTPIVLTSHGGDLFSLRSGIMQYLKGRVLRRAAAITVVSGALEQEARHLSVHGSKTHVIPMGVDFHEAFTPVPEDARHPGEILFVGRLVEKKGVEYLLRALPLVLQAYPSAKLKIVGKGTEETALKDLATTLGLADRVQFLGALPQAELPVHYRLASVFVAPFVQARDGDREGLGLVTVEAIACGCPVIVGDSPALNEIFAPTEADLRLDPNDITALSERIVHHLTHTSEESQRMLALRERLIGRLSWPVVVARYAALLSATAQARHDPKR